jgi:hypothetical protein
MRRIRLGGCRPGLGPAARHAAIFLRSAGRRRGGGKKQDRHNCMYELNEARFHGGAI